MRLKYPRKGTGMGFPIALLLLLISKGAAAGFWPYRTGDALRFRVIEDSVTLEQVDSGGWIDLDHFDTTVESADVVGIKKGQDTLCAYFRITKTVVGPRQVSADTFCIANQAGVSILPECNYGSRYPDFLFFVEDSLRYDPMGWAQIHHVDAISMGYDEDAYVSKVAPIHENGLADTLRRDSCAGGSVFTKGTSWRSMAYFSATLGLVRRDSRYRGGLSVGPCGKQFCGQRIELIEYNGALVDPKRLSEESVALASFYREKENGRPSEIRKHLFRLGVFTYGNRDFSLIGRSVAP